MEELIDVLDENGNKTGEILTREQIHKRGLCHRIVVIVVIDAQGNILMQKRSKSKKENPGKWDVTAAGHVSSGQTVIQAAIRETLEEVGIKINEKELEYILTYKSEKNGEKEICDCYIVKKEKIKLEDIKLQEIEVEQVKLCNLTEFYEIIENGNIMQRDKLYEKITQYIIKEKI